MKGGSEPEAYEPNPIFHGFCYVRVNNWPRGFGWFKDYSSTVGILEAISTLSHDSQIVSWGYIYRIIALGCVTRNWRTISNNEIQIFMGTGVMFFSSDFYGHVRVVI